MEKRKLLFHLSFCTGLGILGKSLIAKRLIEVKDKMDLGDFYSFCLTVLNKNGRPTKKFAESFFSEKVEKAKGENQNVPFLTCCDSGYPSALLESYCFPIMLYYRGKLELISEKHPKLAVVGSRKTTSYGKRVISKLIAKQVTERFVIVSGLASGSDTYAHLQTVRKHGKTIAVIGTGLNLVYPSQNKKIQQYLQEKQLVISEYPLHSQPLPFHFVERNRIIAGLCQKTLVIEAAEHSGSLITANLALQNDRDVLAVPGEISSKFSKGTNKLIEVGAIPCLDVNSLLASSFI